MLQTGEQQIHTCAKCGAKTEQQQAIVSEYKCQQCAYELAHVDVASNGAIRGIFGWLKETQVLICGRYKVETVLGKGGFGATYLVSDQRVVGKRWALKEIPELLFDEYEVTLLSQLDHPSIPIIVDRFTDAGMVYLVLKFGGSKTLATECKLQQKISYLTLKPWIIEIANVLKYLHSRQPPIIHRDLKPENVLIDDEDRVMLIDFGVAKQSVEATVTRTLGRAASHGFSPPEQVMGTGTDVRSDIYSFAATIYFALVGKIPVAAHERVAGAILQSPGEQVTGIPAEIDMVLVKALSLNLNDRPQTITEFLTAFTDNTEITDAADQSGKTVKISDIQFGPVINQDIARSRPLTQPSKEQDQQRNKYSLVGTIVGTLVLILSLAGGAYWYMNKPAKDPVDDMISEKTPATINTKPIAYTEKPTVPTNLKENNKQPSALDILIKKRENQKSTEENIIAEKKNTDSFIPKKPAPIKRALKANNTIKRKVVSQPDWGNQPEGNF